MLWTRNVSFVLAKPTFHFIVFLLHLTLTDDRTLGTGPRSYSAPIRSAGKIVVALLASHNLRPPKDPDLAMDFSPEEYQRGTGVFSQLARFARVVVREEDESPGVNLFEENNACGWYSLGSRGR